MDSVWLELGFGGTFELVEVNFGGSEKLRPSGPSLLNNGF